jgi:nucleoredoxin
MAFLGSKLLLKKTSISTATLNFNLPVLVYFSASWCPPCQRFTPMLIEFYQKVNDKSKECEVILASLDKTSQKFEEYFNIMPWLSIPYEQTELTSTLARNYTVQTIPTLVLVNEQGKMLANDCRDQVAANKEKALETFKNILKKSK